MTEEAKKEGKKTLVEVKVISRPEDLATLLVEAGEQQLVVIDFFADWCFPCKIMSPLVAELAKTHREVIFIKVNIEECDELVDRYGVNSIPTFVFVKAGGKVDSVTGANYDLLTKKIEKHKTPLPTEEAGTS